jgi:hypothetical protein
MKLLFIVSIFACIVRLRSSSTHFGFAEQDQYGAQPGRHVFFELKHAPKGATNVTLGTFASCLMKSLNDSLVDCGLHDSITINSADFGSTKALCLSMDNNDAFNGTTFLLIL